MAVTGIDHVMFAVPSLPAAEEAFAGALGLHTGTGSEHPDWGTRNAVFRFRDTYLELITVADPPRAGARPAGRRMLDVIGDGGGWLAFVLSATGLVDTVAALRADGLDLAEPLSGESVRADGTRRRWWVAGHGESFRTGALPSLIEYEGEHPTAEPPEAGSPAAYVDGIAGVDVAVPDLAEAVGRYALLFGGDPDPGGDDLLAADTATWRLADGRTVRLLAPSRPHRASALDTYLDRRGQGLFGVALAVRRPDAVAAALARRGAAAPPTGRPGEVLVDPTRTLGARVSLLATSPAVR
jgi:catechol 2,3-dioxygenase-like lactoylglutathione lyase family enzyme